ncbi:MAG: hypothetical protein KDK55_06495 [Chlamydiia bacterium]|nr:hypothetical protein [Chlamydiia bacterium]
MILSFALIPGNTDDKKPVPKLIEPKIRVLLFGDRGYISALKLFLLRKQSS